MSTGTKTFRSKRINNSLEQLRKLLPYSANMKKDMASLLEQTVEYINIMHTVLNEDKPACLNKVYLSYRQKTEQIETFRKNFKKTATKRPKSEAGCSWGQPFAHHPQVDINPFTKHPCMSTSYYDTNCVGNPMWQQQKMTESYLLNQPTYSGQSHNHFLSAPPTTSIHSRSIYFPPPTKQFDNSGAIVSTEMTEPLDVSKSATQSASKSGSWQQLTLNNNASPHDLNMRNNLNSPNEATTCKPGAFHNTTGDWHNPAINNSTPKLVTDSASKAQTEYFDENNNATIPCTKTDEPKLNTDKPQCTSDASKEPSNGHISCEMVESSVKCSSPQSTKPVSTPEIYFSSNDANSLCALYGGFGSWNALPPLSLNANYLTATSQPQIVPPSDVSQDTSGVQRNNDH